MKRILIILFLFVSFVYGEVATRENVAKLYVATFNRMPDAGGLDYWVNSSNFTLEQIATSFFDQPETKAMYPTDTSTGSFVRSIYVNVLGREPDEGGFNYWVTELDNHTLTRPIFILAVMNGAQGDDGVLLANKAEVALYFVDKGLSDIDLARIISQSITAEAQTIEDAKRDIDLFITEREENMKPILTMNGVSEVTVTEGETYTEAGATAINYNGETLEVVISGNVDTSVPSTYTVSYTATDSEGHTRTLERTVTVTDKPNVAPTANAGDDETVFINDTVTLNGTGDDEDGEIASYEWKLGGAVVSTTASFDYTAVSVGVSVFTLTVTDDDGATATDTMTLNTEALPNVVPTIDAGADKETNAKTPVTLTATANDSDGSIASIVWKEGDTVLSTTSTLNFVSETVGMHTFTVTATDNSGASVSDTVTVTVNEIPNIAPIANAGEDKTVQEEEAVIILGSGSDSDGNVVGFAWKENGAVLATTASFEYVPTTLGTHVLTLTVTDNEGATGTDTASVIVSETPNVAPVANAGGDQSVQESESITITGTATDSDGEVTTYLWKEGSTVLSNTASLEYVSSTLGAHTLTLTVTDNDGATATDTMVVTITETPNVAPTADAGDNESIMEDEAITVTGSGEDTDGSIVSYEWKENGVLLAETASFTQSFDVLGEHHLTLTVTDDSGASASDMMILTVTEKPNVAPTVNAGNDLNVGEFDTVTITGTATDSDGMIVSYEWKEGAEVLATTLEFDYVGGNTGKHTLTLVVMDDDGDTTTDTMFVTVVANTAPVANAGSDVAMGEYDTVTITGTATDSDGEVVSYEWKDSSGILATTASFEYTAEAVNYTSTKRLTFTVTDNDGKSSSDTMSVLVSNNTKPSVNAGSNKNVGEFDTITITGTAADSDGEIVSYAWKEGTEILATTASFEYTGIETGRHTFIFTVTDDDGESRYDSVYINVVANKVPSAYAGSNKTIYEDQTLLLSGTASDSDGDIVSYEWKEGTEVLSTSTSFTFGIAAIGTYTLTFTVIDDDGATKSDSVKVTVLKRPNVLPTVSAGSNKTVTLGNTLTLTGTASDSDGSIASYRWRKGSTTVSDTTTYAFTPTETGLYKNLYTFTFTAWDDEGAYKSDSMQVTMYDPDGNKLPTASAGTNKTTEFEEAITIGGTGHDSDGTIVSYQWKSGNTVLANTASFTHTATVAGTYTLTLTVTDDYGSIDTDTMKLVVNPPNIPPSVNAGANKSVGEFDTVTVTGSATDSDGTVVEYEWKEGTEILAASASFTYVGAETGTHTLTLTATDDDGDSSTDTMVVTVVENLAPTANAGSNRNVGEFDNITISGSGSDSDGDVVAYEWKEGSEVLSDNASFSYSNDVGTYTLTLTVTDDDGATDTDTMTVNVVENLAPTANAGSDKEVGENDEITVTGSGADSDGSVVSYKWSEGGVTLSNSNSFLYGEEIGVHTLTLTVTDDDGATGSDTVSVEVVANVAPTANAGSDKSVSENDNLIVTGSGTDSDGTVVSYQWKEGSTVISNSTTATFTGRGVGTYTLTLTVTDDDGATDTDTVNIEVTPNVAPTANAGSDKSVSENDNTTVTGSGTDSDGSVVSYEWKEGSTVISNSATATFTGRGVGTYTLTLTVTDDDGATDSDEIAIEVIPNVAPTANAGSDKSVGEFDTVTVIGTATDSDGSVVSYEWKEGSATLSNIASFGYGGTVGTHTLTLTVTDDDGATSSDSINIQVIANTAPTVNAGSDRSVGEFDSITITGTATDSDGTVASYLWKEGSTILSVSSSFEYTGSVTGTHDLTLTVTDDDGATSSDGMSIEVIANVAPTANAGSGDTVFQNEIVSLSGSGSDTDGTVVSYVWKEGSTILSNIASFNYSSNVVGTHTVSFTVTDNDGATDTDSVSVVVNETPNIAPVADAGSDTNVGENDSVTLSGSGTDSDGTITGYEWSEGGVTLSTNASFPYIAGTVGAHTVTLTITDDDGASSSDSVTVTVISNTAPTVYAGADTTVAIGNTVTMTGTASDSDGIIELCEWREGTTVLANTASFSYEGLSLGKHTLTLTVTDDDGESTSDSVDVTVEEVPNIPPVANAGSDKTAWTNDSLYLFGSGTDEDGEVVAYEWKEGTTVLSTSATFVYSSPSETGTHTLSLTVTDDDGDTDTDTVIITVQDPNQPPVVDAGADIKMLDGESVTITGTATDEIGTGGKGAVESYEWTEGGSTIATTASFSYIGTTGTHTLTLTVTDNEGATASDSMTVSVVDNYAPTVNAGADKSVAEGVDVTITGTANDVGGTIVSYEWTEDGGVVATSASFTYTGAGIGTHTFVLTVMDDFGATSSDSMNVEVSAFTRSIPSISSSTKQAYLDAVNDARSQTQDCGSHGIFDPAPPLVWNTALYNAAYEHSQDMGRANLYTAHTGTHTIHDWTAVDNGTNRGSYPDERASHEGYGGFLSNENVAAGSVYNSTSAVISAWLNSDGHCANLMNPDAEDFGMARFYNSSSTHKHYWTQEFGQ